MNKFSGEIHSFDVQLAEEFGIEEAIVIHHFQHWIKINQRLKQNLHEGRTWSYQTQDWIVAHFPYFKNRQKVIRIIDSLVDKKVLIKGNFNKTKFDRTVWYAFNDEACFVPLSENVQCIVQNCTMESPKTDNPKSENVQPIPDILKTNNKTINLSKERESALIFFGEDFKNVKLTSEEHQKLLDKLGSEKLKSLINSLSLYIAQKGDKYKNHYATILKWVMKEKEESSPDSGPPPQFKLAKHRENSKLAFESSKDPWEPDVVWVGAPPGFKDQSQEDSK